MDRPLEAGLEAFSRVLLDAADVQVHWIDLCLSEAKSVETVSAPSLTCTVFFKGEGYRGFTGCPPVPFRPGTFCLGYASSPVRGFGYVPPGASLQFLMVKFAPDVFARLGVQDLWRPSGALVDSFDVGEQPACVAQVPTSPAVERCAREVLEASSSSPAGRALLHAKAWEMLSLGFDHVHTLSRRDVVALSRLDVKRLRDARALLREQPARNWSVAELARAVGLNEKKLKRGYRELFATSVYKSLQEQRLELCAQMLDEDTRSISDIAEACGYYSASHLGRYFKARFGLSPAAWRRRGR